MQEENISTKAKFLWKELIKQVAKKSCHQIRDGNTSVKD